MGFWYRRQGLHVEALSLPPLSTVQAGLSGGLSSSPYSPSDSSDFTSGAVSGPA
jgi:hypothetical protein